jgi:hypothetical protein
VFVLISLSVSLYSLVCLPVGLWQRGRSRTWLPLSVAAAQLLLVLWFAFDLVWFVENGDSAADLLHIIWCGVAVAFLLLAAFAVKHAWPHRGSMVVLSLLLPAPLMALLFAVITVHLADR